MLRGVEARAQLGEHAGEVAGEERTRGEMHPRERPAVFTIGHSNHSLEGFFALLGKHRAATVADVRSVPYNRFVRHFSRQPLAAALAARGIDYLFLGRELGGRRDDPGCYERGRIVYDRVAGTESFRDGIGRVVRGSAEHRIALMCAEREPLDCHRTLLVAPALEAAGAEVVHILADGALGVDTAGDRAAGRTHRLRERQVDPGSEDRSGGEIGQQGLREAHVGDLLPAVRNEHVDGAADDKQVHVGTLVIPERGVE